jgi:hypothetical protein
MQSNERINIGTWFDVLDDYIAEVLPTPRQPEQQEALVTLCAGARTLRELWEQQSSVAIATVTADDHMPTPVSDTHGSIRDWEPDPIIKLLIRHNCRLLRFGRRPVRAQATINADGWVRDLDTGMVMTDVDGWIYARALEQRDDGYYKSAAVNQYTQVDVFIGCRWIKLGRFLAGAQSEEEETPPALPYAA